MDVRDFDSNSSYWSNKYATLLKGAEMHPTDGIAQRTAHFSPERDFVEVVGRGDAHSESRVKKEQELRIRAEQEQARLIGVNHELTLQLDRLKSEGDEGLRDLKCKVVELESQLVVVQGVHKTDELSLGKYRVRAEQVMRELEASQADQERSRRRAEEALARTVAAAHAKLTAKQEALDSAEASRTEESTLRIRLQSQLEAFISQHASTIQQLDSQLASSKARELDLSTKLSEANQRVEELTRRQALSDANTLSVQALLAGVGGGDEKLREKEAEREEWERAKRATAQREAELCARLAEQNHIIRLLRQTLASSSPSPGAIPMPASAPFNDSKIYELQTKNGMLQQSLDEQEAKLKALTLELDEANERFHKLDGQTQVQIEGKSHLPALEEKRLEELTALNLALTDEKKKQSEDIAFKLREIQALKDKLEQQQKELDLKSTLVASAQVMQAEMDESHVNEIKLLEQVEQYEFMVMQLRGRVAELERFIVEDTGGAFGPLT